MNDGTQLPGTTDVLIVGAGPAGLITRVATIDSVPLRKARNALLPALDWVPAVHHWLAMSLSELTVGPERHRR